MTTLLRLILRGDWREVANRREDYAQGRIDEARIEREVAKELRIEETPPGGES